MIAEIVAKLEREYPSMWIVQCDLVEKTCPDYRLTRDGTGQLMLDPMGNPTWVMLGDDLGRQINHLFYFSEDALMAGKRAEPLWWQRVKNIRIVAHDTMPVLVRQLIEEIEK